MHSIRIRSDLHSLLLAAAAVRGKSLSDEIQNRLRRTFIDDEKITDNFGDRRNFLFLRAVALAIQQTYNPDQPNADWLKDPFVFDQAIRTITAVLNAIRPQTPIETPSDDLAAAIAEIRPNNIAAELWKAVQDADPLLPLDEGTRGEHLAGLLKAELGDIAARPTIVSGRADDFRRAAAGMCREAKGSAPKPFKQRKKKKKEINR